MSDIAPDSEAQTNQQKDKVDKSFLGGLPDWMHLAIKICLGLWFVNFLIGIVPIEDRGTFGDTFGAANSLFSALALLGVAWSVSMQRDELRLTREQREATQKNLDRTQTHLEKQEENIAKQNAATERQMFEATFFRLLESLSEISKDVSIAVYDLDDSLEASDRGIIASHQGRKAFAWFQDHVVRGHFDKEQGQFYSEDHLKETLKPIYWKAYRDYGNDLGHYFRVLFTILRFVRDADLGNHQYFYSKLVRAQLSNDEANVAMLNYLSGNTTEDFNELVDRYGMLKNVEKLDRMLKVYVPFVNEAAFGKSYVKEQEDLKIKKRIMERYRQMQSEKEKKQD